MGKNKWGDKMEQKRKSIGTDIYLVTQMDAISALKIQTKLIKILGPGMFSFVGKGGDIKDKMKSIIPMLMDNFDDELITGLVLSLFEKNIFVERSGQNKVVDFATHFAGKPMEMWKVAAFILETNFSMGESIESSLPTTEEGNQTQGN